MPNVRSASPAAGCAPLTTRRSQTYLGP
jgi:hypothetical protein